MLRGKPTVLQHKLGEMKPNSLGLPYTITKPISDSLNILLASSYVLYHQVKKHAWVVNGPERMAWGTYLIGFSRHLEQIADELAVRVTQLGAYPISSPRKQQEMAIFAVEEEGVFDVKIMLEHDLHACQKVMIHFREIIRQAFEAGDYGTEQLLKNQLQVIEGDVHRLHGLLMPHE